MKFPQGSIFNLTILLSILPLAHANTRQPDPGPVDDTPVHRGGCEDGTRRQSRIQYSTALAERLLLYHHGLRSPKI
jgi:hypothetical protein